MIYHNGDASSITQEERSTGELNLKDNWGPYRKGRELRKWGGTSRRQDREGQWFELTAPDGSAVWPIRNDGGEGHWRWGQKNPQMMEILAAPEKAHWEKRPFANGKTYQRATDRWVPYEKIRDKKRAVGWSTWLDEHGFNSDATRELKEIFGEKAFETPKPTALLKWIVSLHDDSDAVVLDSFAGSGTTAHAVLALNQEDGGNRRFVLVETEDYADTITAERVRRVIKGVPTAKDDALKAGLGGTFSFFKLGKPMRQESLLDGSNLPDYEALAAYVFFTATGEEWNPKRMKRKEWFIGESRLYDVYLIYEPDVAKLKDLALTLEMARGLPKGSGKNRLVFAPTKYLDQEFLAKYRITFQQLPFQIYKVVDSVTSKRK